MNRQKNGSEYCSQSTVSRLMPWLLFVLLTGATMAVWWQQGNHQRALLVWHTRDVAFQSSRRLEIFVESRLVVAEIFAQRWSTHERRDFSRQRFSRFAAVLLGRIPGFHAVWLVRSDLSGGWLAPPGGKSMFQSSSLRQWQVFRQARRRRKTIVSAPVEVGRNGVRFVAVLPLYRGSESLGYLVVEFDAKALFRFCFQERIRSEFSFKIEDSGRLLYQHSPDARHAPFADAPIRTRRPFKIRNRTWRMTVRPRTGALSFHTSWRNLPILVLGLLLSTLMSGLLALSNRRSHQRRLARAQAHEALKGRAAAQCALEGSEARYRSVFDSASDGLLVVDNAELIVDANRAACRLLGYEPEVLVGRKADVIVEPKQRESYEVFYKRLALEAAARIELSAVTLGGATLDVEMKGNVFSYGDTSRVLLIVSDVTERRVAQRRLAMLSRKVLQAQEAERGRVARDLHDELGQIITALRLELDLSRKQLPVPLQIAEAAFKGPIGLLEKATAELRRICYGLRPPLLDDLGLGPAVKRQLERFGRRTGIEISSDLQIDDGVDVPGEVALVAYRVIQESMTNIARHSQATRLMISLRIDSWQLLLSIYDNGVGFDRGGMDTSDGSGIAGMQERARFVGGRLKVQAVQRQGTRIVLEIPLPYHTSDSCLQEHP